MVTTAVVRVYPSRRIACYTKSNVADWPFIQLVVAVGINCFGARLYGNVEFWFAMVSILFAPPTPVTHGFCYSGEDHNDRDS